MKKILTIVGCIVTLAAATFVFVRGVKAQDNQEIERNATNICLSCMGIQ